MLINKWNMSYGEWGGLECTVPCTMYGVLLEHKKIDDPFYGLNELKSTQLSDKGCVFESKFNIDTDILEKDFVELTFYGLDTICQIILNGNVIDKTMNMHRAYTYNVKDILVEGENVLTLKFDSPTEYFKAENNKHYAYSDDGNTIPGAIHLRKALCMSGWDWGPELPDMGIFRKVELDAYDYDKIDDVFVKQNHIDGKVELEIYLETKHNADVNAVAEIDGKTVSFVNGCARVEIDSPKLWWANGYGEQYLYDLNVIIKKDEKVIDNKSQKIGLRTITVCTQKDELGSEFSFVLNGHKIFMMGANYIPQDNILSRITTKRSEALIKSCVDANYNCLRVWGGGYYPEDEFYELCDKYGLLVWQDFMVACGNVYLTKKIENEFINEAIYNVKRLRNHPSLGMLCGNNEMEAGILNWDIPKGELVKMDYIRLYEKLLREISDEYAPQTFYWPSSPCSGGGFEDPSNKLKGDSHYWDVWHDNEPFVSFRKYLFRFCSEYGFEAYPSMKTIRAFCDEKNMNCFSRVMENHQKCKSGNQKMLTYLADTFLYPTSFENLVYASQMLQADAIKYGVEHFRRIRGICMGSIYWQVNDCWPVASWSSVDYYGRYKALHYAAKKFYAPVAIGLFDEKGKIIVNVANETMNDFEGTVIIKACNNNFDVISEKTEKVNVKALSSEDTVEIEISILNDIYSEFFVAEIYDKDGNFIMKQTNLLVPPKHFDWKKPNINIEAKNVDGKIELSVTSDVFAKGVYIDSDNMDFVMSENFFDITSKAPYKVTVDVDMNAEEFLNSIKIKTVYDIGV